MRDIHFSVSTNTLENILKADDVFLEQLRFHDPRSKEVARKTLLSVIKRREPYDHPEN
jgi:hypothetical protein